MKFRELTGYFKIEVIFLSFFGIGFIPVAPGTMGSFVTLPILYCIALYNIPIIFLIPFLIILIVGTCFVTEHYQKLNNIKDPGWIVIDEVIGMIITWLFYPSTSLLNLAIAFIYFRIFVFFNDKFKRYYLYVYYIDNAFNKY